MHIVGRAENRCGAEALGEMAQQVWNGDFNVRRLPSCFSRSSFTCLLSPSLVSCAARFLLDCCSFDLIFHLIIQMEQKEKNVK